MIALFVSLLCALGSAPGAAETVLPSRGLPALREQIANRDWAAAESLAVRLLDELGSGRAASAADSLDLAEVLDALVQARAALGRGSSPETVKLARRALGIRERALGPDHPDVGVALRGLARILYESGDLAAALPLAERALRLHEATLDSTDLRLAATLENRAFLHGAGGELEAALALFQRALAIRREVLGPDDLTVAAVAHRTGFTMSALGEFAPAMQLMEEALRVRQAALPADDPELATSYNDLAIPHYYLGNYARAESLLVQAISIRERQLGPEHPALAKSIDLLGIVQLDTGRIEEAQQSWTRALRIREKAQGPDHRSVAGVLVNLMLAAQALGAYEDAAALCERALDIYERTLGSDHPLVGVTLNNLGSVYRDLGDHARARRRFEQSLSIQTKALGPEHPELAHVLWNLGSLLVADGDLAAARPLLERSLAIRLTALGPDHPEIATNLEGLAQLARREGRSTEARTNYEQALAIANRHPGSEAVAAGCLAGLADLAADQGDLAQAESLYSAALTIRRERLGEEHPLLAETMESLGWVAAARGRTHDALDLALGAERIARDHLRMMLRTAPEQIALRLAANRTRGLDLALTLLKDGSDDRARQVWDELVRSRAIVLDGVAERRRDLSTAARLAAGGTTDSLWSAWVAARRRLGHLMMQGEGSAQSDFPLRLEESRRRVEHLERVLATASAELSGDFPASPVTLDEVIDALPPGASLVSYVRAEPASPVPANDTWRAPAAFYAAFLLRAGVASGTTLEISFVPLGDAARIDQLVERWRDEVRFGFTIPGRPAALAQGEYERVALELRQAIWDPLATHLAGASRIFIVPDGSLHMVSMAALPAEGGGYLIELDPLLHHAGTERDLVVRECAEDTREDIGEPILALGDPDFDAPSADIAAALAAGHDTAARDPESGALPVPRGQPAARGSFRDARFQRLPGSAREVEEIARISPLAVRRLTGAAASEAAFKSLAPGRRILHLATHGFFHGEAGVAGEQVAGGSEARGIAALVQRPVHAGQAATGESAPAPAAGQPLENPLLLSGLALAGANLRDATGPDEEDGILTAEEIGALHLYGTDWAVLSACDSGIGVLHAAEGALGLERAFRTAGARTVVMSLWAVEDSSAVRWMAALYEARLQGRLDAAACMRAAALRLLAVERAASGTAHPYRWGAFVALGDWR